RPYAKAAFDYANENGVVNEWENFLFIAATVVNDKSFSTWLDNPAVSAEHKSAALVDLYDTQVASANDSAFTQLLGETHGTRHNHNADYPTVSVALSNLAKQLAEHALPGLLRDVYEHYRRHQSVRLKQPDAYVTSAYPLTDAQRQTFQPRVADRLK